MQEVVQPIKTEITFNAEMHNKLEELSKMMNVSPDVIIHRALAIQIPRMGRMTPGEFASDSDYYEYVRQQKR